MADMDRDPADKAPPTNLETQLDRLLGRPGHSVSAEELAACRRADALGIRIDMIGGNCPVQAEGYFDDKAFYFRAKYRSWLIEVGPKEIPWSCDEWETEHDWGAGDDAGWMPIHVAIGLIGDGVEEYRAARGRGGAG